jgi:transglutaminase-like putative cysteine protease
MKTLFYRASTSIINIVSILGGVLMILPNAMAGDYEALYAIERQIVTVKVNADGSSEKIEELTTLIRSQLAVDSESQADIEYNSSFENVEVLDAYTILPSGEKVPVASNAIRTVEDDISSGTAMFSDAKHRIIIFPKVTAGAKTFYKVKTISHTPLFQNHYTNRLIFSPLAEYGYVEINLSHHPDIHIKSEAREVKGGRIDKGSDGQIRYQYTFMQPDIKIKEPSQVSLIDFAPAIFFSSFESQIEFAKAYEDRAKPKAAVTPAVKQLADKITKDIQDPKDQARALYNWVSKEIRYVAIYMGAGGMVPHDADSIIHNHYGDCKDHNTILIALLAAKGIEASTAIINAGTAYEMPNLAVIGPMNHVITYLPKWDIYVDSTQELAPFASLPYEEMDKPVILTALNKLGRTPKMTAENNQIITHVHMKIQQGGEIEGTSHTTYKGGGELVARGIYSAYAGSTEEKIVKNHLRKFGQTGIGKFKPTDAYKLDKQFELLSEFTLDPISNIPGLGAMIIPVGLSQGELATIASNRPKDKFHFPYICSSFYKEENYNLEFPSNVTITRIPTNMSQHESGIEYQATYIQKGNVIKVKRSITSQRHGMVCQPQELEHWKNIHKAIQRDLRAQIFYE